MTAYVPATLIKELEEALTNSVPARRHNDVLAALKRCQELIGRLASTIEDLDARHAYSDLMFEAKLYANVLGGFFDEKDMVLVKWMDIGKGYNPREYLADKGVIKPINPTRVKMEEQFAADRKVKQDDVDRILSDLGWERAQQKLKRAQRKAATLVEPVKPKPKRGRPVGSKNKPKTGVRK